MGGAVGGRGRFITIEGGEGVGKSALTRGLVEALRARGHEVVATREPGGTPAADRIRAVFATAPADDPLAARTEALLVSAARAQHVERLVAPALARGAWVVSDRYADSTRVYQGTLLGLPADELETLIAYSTGGLAPDLTLLLDLGVTEARARLAGRGLGGAPQVDAVTRYDEATTSDQERLREAFLALARRFPARFVTLDASVAPGGVLRAAVATVEARLGQA